MKGSFGRGNARERRTCLEQTLLLKDEPQIAARHFHLRGRMKQRAVTAKLAGTDSGRVEVEVPDEGMELQKVEDALIDRTLTMCDGNVSRAARMLGVSRDQLRYRLAKRGA